MLLEFLWKWSIIAGFNHREYDTNLEEKSTYDRKTIYG